MHTRLERVQIEYLVEWDLCYMEQRNTFDIPDQQDIRHFQGFPLLLRNVQSFHMKRWSYHQRLF